MKKTIAILLGLAIMLGFGTMALATGADSTPQPTKSTYEFRFAVPDNIVPGQDVLLPVTFRTLTIGDEGYNNVRFEIVNTVAPAGGSVTFKAKDLANRTISFTNYGIYLPSPGFKLPAQYHETTDWTLNFSKSGTYVINFKAYDGNHYKIAEASRQIAVADGSFTCTIPEEIIAGQEITANVSFVTDYDFEDVHFEFAKTAGNGDVLFKARDSNGTWYTFVNRGVWGSDFDITAPYSESTPWKLTFSKAGKYTIKFRLVDSTGKVLIEDSESVTVKESADDEDEVEDEDKDDDSDVKCPGNTHGLKNALRNHLKHRKHWNEKARAQSTARLLELLQQRGISLEDLKELIKEMEEEIKKDKGSDEDYRILSRMYKLKGERYKTYINGKKVDFDVNPIVVNGRTLVPFRTIAEELGADVQWLGAEKKVIVTKGKTTVILVLGQDTAIIEKGNSKTRAKLDAPALLHNNRTMVPIRFLSESLGAKVDYYSEGSLVVIKT